MALEVKGPTDEASSSSLLETHGMSVRLQVVLLHDPRALRAIRRAESDAHEQPKHLGQMLGPLFKLYKNP